MDPLHTTFMSPFDESSLGAVSRRLSEAVFTSLPQLRRYAHVAKSGELDGLSLIVTVPSPTGNSDRQFVIWVDEISAPSIGFGPSHAHESNDAGGIALIVDLAGRILDDTLLIIEDVGGKYPGHSSWIDLRKVNALEEELTSPYSPGCALLKSWSGKGDRQVSMENLGAEALE